MSGRYEPIWNTEVRVRVVLEITVGELYGLRSTDVRVQNVEVVEGELTPEAIEQVYRDMGIRISNSESYSRLRLSRPLEDL